MSAGPPLPSSPNDLPPSRDEPDHGDVKEVPRGGLEFRLAILAVVGSVVAGTVGAAVGGYASYRGSKALDEQSSHAAARGVARVLQSQMHSAGIRFRWAVENRRYVDPADPSLRIHLGIEDQKLIATSTSAASWSAVAACLGSLQTASDAQLSPLSLHGQASDAAIALYVGTLRAIDDADKALSHLTGISNSAP